MEVSKSAPCPKAVETVYMDPRARQRTNVSIRGEGNFVSVAKRRRDKGTAEATSRMMNKAAFITTGENGG